MSVDELHRQTRHQVDSGLGTRSRSVVLLWEFYATGKGHKAAFKLRDEKQNDVFIPFTAKDEYVLIKVAPGTYHSEFYLYSWNGVFWDSFAFFRMPKSMEDDFAVEPNRVYYLGDLSVNLETADDHFVMLRDYSSMFRKQFPQFGELEVGLAYGKSGEEQ